MGALPWNERLVVKGSPAWHDLGTVFTQTLTGPEALRASRCDYQVKKVPAIFFGWEDGEVMTVPGKSDIIRQPTDDDPQPRRLSKGSVKEDYVVMQNTELVEMFAPIYEAFPIETMGALFLGRDFFMTCKAGVYMVAGTDPVEQYINFWLQHSGSAALRISLAGNRQVCENTVVGGWNSARARISVNHSKGMKSELVSRRDMLLAFAAAKQRQGQDFDAMAAAVIEPFQIDEILLAAFPDRNTGTVPEKVLDFEEFEAEDEEAPEYLVGPARAYETQEANNEEIRRFAKDELLPKFNDENPSFANTAWAAYNMVTYLLTHMTARQKNGDENGRGRPAQSIVFGPRNRMIAKAYAAALKQAKRPTKFNEQEGGEQE